MVRHFLRVVAVVGIILGGCVEDDETCPNGNGGNGTPSNPTINYGSLTDTRDGKTYRTVAMPDGRTWMAENLNFVTDDSWCYEDNPANCNTYGRLYTWVAAMAIDTAYYTTVWNNSGLNHQGICPDGWRIPSQYDWNELAVAANTGAINFNNEGTRLKSRSGWRMNGSRSGNGTDDLGFSGLPAGQRMRSGVFDHVGLTCYWWTTASGNHDLYSDIAGARLLWHSADHLGTGTTNTWSGERKRNANSVRCVTD